jgi:MoaA/NifB/PqqE/SkfB family radical SAM enzyme
MIDYAHRKGIIVRISSNLMHCSESVTQRIADSHCDFLLLSLYGASQESVSRYQAGADFSRVTAHAALIMKQRKHFPVVVWRFLVNCHNEHEIAKAQKMAGQVADVLEVSGLHCDVAEEIFLDNRGQYENIKTWLPRNERWSVYDYAKRGKKRQRTNSCSYLYTNPSINWDGSLSPCCLLWYEKYDFGNVLRDGFKAIWNNSSYRASRRLIFKGKPDGVTTVCAICRKNRAML